MLYCITMEWNWRSFCKKNSKIAVKNSIIPENTEWMLIQGWKEISVMRKTNQNTFIWNDYLYSHVEDKRLNVLKV